MRKNHRYFVSILQRKSYSFIIYKMSDYFFAPFTEKDLLLTIQGEEFHHLTRVSRFKEGETFLVSNGKGLQANATLLEITKKGASCQLSNLHLFPPKQQTTVLAFALIKNIDRMEMVVEGASQMGISEIYFFAADRSIRKELTPSQLHRLHEIAKSGSKVSKNPYLPCLSVFSSMDKIPFEQSHLWIGDLLSKNTHFQHTNKPGKTIFIIGPEGDFTDRERLLLKEKKAEGILLTPSTLRAEMAALCAAFLLTRSNGQSE